MAEGVTDLNEMAKRIKIKKTFISSIAWGARLKHQKNFVDTLDRLNFAAISKDRCNNEIPMLGVRAARENEKALFENEIDEFTYTEQTKYVNGYIHDFYRLCKCIEQEKLKLSE